MRPIEGIWAGVIQTPTVTPTFTPSSTLTQTVGASPSVTPTFTPTPTPTPTVTPSIHSQWVAENTASSDNYVAAAGTLANTNNYVIFSGFDSNVVSISDDGINFIQSGTLFPIEPIRFVQGFNGSGAGVHCYAAFGTDASGRKAVYYSDATTNNPMTWSAATMETPIEFGENWGQQVAYFYNNNDLYAIAIQSGVNYAYCTSNVFPTHWTTFIPFQSNFPNVGVGIAVGPTNQTVPPGNINQTWIITTGSAVYRSQSSFGPLSAFPSSSDWIFLTGISVGGSTKRQATLAAYGNGTFVIAVVDTNGPSPVTNFYTSPDSVTWTYQTPAFPVNGFSSFYWDPIAANFIGAVNNNNNNMYHSFDGINWFIRPCPNIFNNALAGGQFGPISVGFNGNIQRYGF